MYDATVVHPSTIHVIWLTVLGLVQNSNVGGYSSKGFVEVLAASQTQSGSRWFQGTADAVRQYLWLFEDAERSGVEDFLILSGDTCVLSNLNHPALSTQCCAHLMRSVVFLLAHVTAIVVSASALRRLSKQMSRCCLLLLSSQGLATACVALVLAQSTLIAQSKLEQTDKRLYTIWKALSQ